MGEKWERYQGPPPKKEEKEDDVYRDWGTKHQKQKQAIQRRAGKIKIRKGAVRV